MSEPRVSDERELTYEDRATWGECPVCHAADGKPCHPEVGIHLGHTVGGGPPKGGAHLGRLNEAPQRADMRLRDCRAELAALKADIGSPERIADRCPSCGAQSLFIGSGGFLTCSVIGCQEPGVGHAVHALKARCAKAERGDMFRAGVEAAANVVESFYPASDEAADLSARQCAEQAATAARALCAQPVDGYYQDEIDQHREQQEQEMAGSRCGPDCGYCGRCS